MAVKGGWDKPSRYNDSLWVGQSGDRIPVRVRFSAPNQAGPVIHPASYAMGTRSFPGVKQPGHDVDHPPLSSAEVEGRVQIYMCSLCGTLWPVLG
jgi:hypothetical protein